MAGSSLQECNHWGRGGGGIKSFWRAYHVPSSKLSTFPKPCQDRSGHDPWPQGAPSLVVQSYLACWAHWDWPVWSLWMGGLQGLQRRGAPSWSWRRTGCGKLGSPRGEGLTNLLPLSILGSLLIKRRLSLDTLRLLYSYVSLLQKAASPPA